jgi:hypothetical protein
MTGIPKEYAFLSAVGVLPRMITEGLALLGTNEIPGSKSNAVIMSWERELEREGFDRLDYGNDDIPWCGLFMAICALRAGKTPVANPLWARNWQHFDNPIRVNAGSELKPRLISSGFPRPNGPPEPSLGDVCVFIRPGGGHVAMYIAEDPFYFHVLGGNQSNSVTITRVRKDRCIAVRRANMMIPPASMHPYNANVNGAVSVNEA